LKIYKVRRRIIIAGGGTGGHIFPALAIANALRKKEPDMDILFVGANGKMEMEKIPEAGYPIKGIDIAGYNRSSLIKNIALPYKLVKSLLQVKGIFKSFQPEAAIGVGGYSTFPVLRYAQAKSIPTFIHESNSLAGKSNRMLGKKATRIFAASDGMEKYFPAERLVYSGNPLRKNVVASPVSRTQGLEFFGLDPQFLTVLVDE
jgi:UDP-N-acetylglucosamine--N-acetylmuramyl-(pentapeptide) pyrophosphoryl-undecaprenol N-acetylglucosamine transferase